MSIDEIRDKFKNISIWEIAEFWIYTYPEDIFINGIKDNIGNTVSR